MMGETDKEINKSVGDCFHGFFKNYEKQNNKDFFNYL